jgi:iron(III) transport system ATP-binding protein
VFQATIHEVEFLGAFCHVHVMAPALCKKPLTVYLSLNFLAEQNLQAGSSLPLKLMPERIKLF